MAQIYLPKGIKSVLEFRTEIEYNASCAEHTRKYGKPLFEMMWPNKKVFKVFRDKSDNQIEIIYNPIRILDTTI